jgi:lysyl-tRNA synthetase, class I
MAEESRFWAKQAADDIVKTFPNLDVYTFAAGISPSGTVHFGNFRDVMTSIPVIEELKKRGLKTRFVFSWDDYDRFRKVPANVPSSFEKYIGLPLSAVPDPEGKVESYARHFQIEFEEAMKALEIDMEYFYQTKEYQSGRYKESIIYAMDKREEIAKILLSLMSKKAKNEKGID